MRRVWSKYSLLVGDGNGKGKGKEMRVLSIET
jgi:hypothetical protein